MSGSNTKIQQLDGQANQLLGQIDRFHAALRAYHLIDDTKSQTLESALDAARRQRLGERPDSLLSILLLGASGAGKSELLNALAGARIAKSHHARPTTTRPTIYAHDSVPSERLFEFGTTIGTMASDPSNIVRHQRPELRQKILIDAPDIDSFRTTHREQVLELLPAVDLILYVVTGWTYRDDIGWRTVLEGRGHRAIAFVMNKWDRDGRPPKVSPDRDVDEDFLFLLHQGGWDEPVLYRTSAAWWSRNRSQVVGETPLTLDPKAPPAGDQFADLEKWISTGLSTSEVAQIQRRKRRGLWGSLAASIVACRPHYEQLGPWQKSMEMAFKETQIQIVETLVPTLEEAARAASAQIRREEIPDTPGPYGQAQRLTRAFIQSWSLPRFHPLSSSNSGLTSGTTATNDPSSSGPVADILHRSLARLTWSARQVGLPVTWLEEQWTTAPREAAEEVAAAARAALVHPSMATPAWRLKTARILAWTLDAILIIAVIATTYRLTMALLLGQGTTVGYVLSFLTLLFCVILLGNTALAVLLPDRNRWILQRLRQTVAQSVEKALVPPLQTAKNYGEDLRKLEQAGLTLEAAIDQQIAELQKELVEAQQEPEVSAATRRLFAEVSG